jgi:Zn-dependent protease
MFPLGHAARTRWDVNFRLARIPVRIHPLFWLVAFLFASMGTRGLVPVLSGMAALTIAIVLHEFGHAYSAHRYGVRGIRILIYAFGGVATVPGGLRRRQRIWNILWGPLPGLILGVGLLLLFQLTSLRPPAVLAHFVRELIQWNLVLSIFNLIPVYPLDGGLILREILIPRCGGTADLKTYKASMWVAIAVAVLAVFFRMYFIVVIYGLLAYYNHHLAENARRFGAPRVHREPTEPWERGSDWWKR